MKKKMLMASSLVAVSALSILGTKAYLQDTDTDVNVMTTGNVKIEQHEYERKVDKDGNFISTNETDEYGYTPEKLQEFTQAKPIYPAVYDKIMWDDRNGSTAENGTGHQQSWKEVGAPGSNQLFDANMKNVQDKFVFVENTGKSDAYYRTIIAVETPEGTGDLIHTNISGNSRFDWETISDVDIDGVNYTMYVATYNQVLKPGEVSRPSFLQAFLGKEATNEDVAKFGETFEILVASQAVQTTGFDSASKALEEVFGNIGVDNHPFDGVDMPTVSKIEDMQKAVAEGKNVIMISDIKDNANQSSGYGKTLIAQTNGGVIDGGNNTLTATGAGGTWDSTIYTKGGTIKNININGGFRGIFIAYPKEDIVIDSVNIESVYTISADDGGNKALIVKNSALNGWTSYTKNFSSVTFINSSFGKGAGYAYFRPYAGTTMTNCDFDLKAGYQVDTNQLKDGEKLTLINCTINGVAITEDNISSLVNNLENVVIK
ncbi:hypothetical protein [Turicibacter sanguinis]|uniref:hypothetical protein n=1 Tax=Turicibacter sanguinis TaxID=154288 RepID=UPI00189F35C5|nr:hypothetical protein [Turicibacter sanguinis]